MDGRRGTRETRYGAHMRSAWAFDAAAGRHAAAAALLDRQGEPELAASELALAAGARDGASTERRRARDELRP